MQYQINGRTLQGFIQFITLPQAGDNYAYPKAEQIRGGASLLERVRDLVVQAKEQIAWMEEKYHTSKRAAQLFSYGTVLTSPGEPLLLVTIQRRAVSLMTGNNVLVANIQDLDKFLKAVEAELRRLQD